VPRRAFCAAWTGGSVPGLPLGITTCGGQAGRTGREVGREACPTSLPWPPTGSVRVRPQSFLASPVRRHTVFKYRSCLALCQVERAGYASVAVVGGPVKVKALVLIGNGILRLVAADVDVSKGMCHGE